jgi:site-specific DNA-methyltransferase (adenine-specific)
MWLYSSGFPKSQDIGKSIERSEGKRKKLPSDNGSAIVGMGTACPTCGKKENGSNQYKCSEDPCPLKEVLQPADNEWAGWGTNLKPAHEPICLARKPIRGSIASNCQTWGVGALHIDAGRVPYESEQDKASIDHKVPTAAWSGHTQQTGSYVQDAFVKVETNQLGRFPSNVIGEIPDYQKYYYCPKVSPRERMEFNTHPTVKPIALMKYLIQLITPAGGRVLDPFTGSGSTGCAAVELDYDYTGIELDANYVDIATKRIAAWYKQTHATTYTELFTDA